MRLRGLFIDRVVGRGARFVKANAAERSGVISEARICGETMDETVSKRAMTRSVPKEESHSPLI